MQPQRKCVRRLVTSWNLSREFRGWAFRRTNFGDRNCTAIRVHNGPRDSLQTESESPLLICPSVLPPRWCYFADSSSTQFELTSSSTLFKQRPRSGGPPRLLISVPPSVTTNARESANKFTRRVARSYSLERQCAQCNIAIPQTSMLIARLRNRARTQKQRD